MVLTSRRVDNRPRRQRLRSPVGPLLVATFVLGASLPGTLAAQDPLTALDPAEAAPSVRLVVSVLDRLTREAVPAAALVLLPVDSADAALWSAVADTLGRAQSGPIPVGLYRLEVSALSFVSVSQVLAFTDARITDVRVELVRADYELAPIVVSVARRSILETSGFDDRRRLGIGYFMTRDEIEARGASSVSELFRVIPGVQLMVGRPGLASRIRLRGGCVPLYVIDGQLLSGPVIIDDLLAVRDVEAFEVYHGASVPITYSNLTTCGVVMFWTRDPLTDEGRPLSWRRLLGALALAAAIVFHGP
jgi:hypothetical protein